MKTRGSAVRADVVAREAAAARLADVIKPIAGMDAVEAATKSPATMLAAIAHAAGLVGEDGKILGGK